MHMCLILFGYQISEKYPLILAANRDEFHQRPTAPMHFWETDPAILAGRDLEQGGTWFGINRKGRFAGLTNYREPATVNPDAVSRGEIIIDFLSSATDIPAYFNAFNATADRYNGFNLLFGSKDELYWYSNKKKMMEKIPPGIHGLSNHFLNTPWPKIQSGKKALENIINSCITPEALFSMLTDQHRPEDKDLPDTGVGIEWERLLSPLFIQDPSYGTRSSTVMLMDKNGHVEITERTYSSKNKNRYSDCCFSFAPEAPL